MKNHQDVIDHILKYKESDGVLIYNILKECYGSEIEYDKIDHIQNKKCEQAHFSYFKNLQITVEIVYKLWYTVYVQNQKSFV